jgi:isoquinoline 1-oxidoreductase beta subunit
MSTTLNLSRRRFLESSLLAGGGLVLGTFLPRVNSIAAETATAEKSVPLNAFVRIGTDDVVTIMINHTEMGQGTFTSLPMLVVEELEADWSKVRPEHAPADPAYNHVAYGVQMVGGSTSVRTEWERLRKMGASARMMLVAAAAEEWSVPSTECTAEKSLVHHKASGKKLTFGELAEAAAKQTPPDDVPLKNPKEFKIIGKSLKRLDALAKTNGTGVFGLDVTLPKMLVAVIARPPVFGGKLKNVDSSKAKALAGVRDVVEIERGVAVVADGFWPAKKGRELLELQWDDGALSELDSRRQLEEYAELAKKPDAPKAKSVGNVTDALESAEQTIDAVYSLPYLAHATMEPMNCVADVRPDGCDVYTGTQFQTADHMAAIKITGLKPDQVKLHTMLAGGGFGRRAVIDSHFVSEAVELSKKLGVPVKVVWTREDDMHGGYYRPAAYHSIKVGLGKDGKPSAWQHRIVCQSFITGTPFESAIIKNGIDDTAVEGAADTKYDIPNFNVEWNEAPGGVPTLWWRSVGHSHTAFAMESLIDELAHAVGKDPVEYRLSLLEEHPRHQRVLKLAAEKGNWGSPMPKGKGRGIALHESFGSILSHVVEVSITDDGKVKVDRVVAAVDCGPVVNPEILAAQLEGGSVFGLTAALYGEISFKNGRVEQRNFHDYPMMRMNDMPVIETHIVPSTDSMGGIGEPGVPPLAPALANAVFAATGKRVRQLPIRHTDLRT